jgi:hypothetical protein
MLDYIILCPLVIPYVMYVFVLHIISQNGKINFVSCESAVHNKIIHNVLINIKKLHE